MSRGQSPEIDDELFNEVYGKEYTGPFGSRADDSSKGKQGNKRAAVSNASDEEENFFDPNAVPTDFTSREAKVWEAKAKAIERNWKKRKEEEMICKLCGESGHFTQGCPSTLGGNRKSADFFERVPARDKNVRSLFSEKVIDELEKDVGCKIRMDEKFLFVSGKDRSILAKGVDAVHKIIQEGKSKADSPPSSRRTRSKSPDRSPVSFHSRRPEPQRSHSTPRDTPRYPSRSFSKERVFGDHDQRSFSRGSPQARAYSDDGGRDRSDHPSSSPLPNYSTWSSFGQNHNTGSHKIDNWDSKRHGVDFHAEHKIDSPGLPWSLEDMELEYKQEAFNLAKTRDQQEDDENYRHRERVREIREDYIQKLAELRATHARKWEEFLQVDVRRRQQVYQNAYDQQVHSNFNQPSRNPKYTGSTVAMEGRSRYPYHTENYSSSAPRNVYGEYQSQTNDGFGRGYGQC